MKVSELRIGNFIKHNVKDDFGHILQPNAAAITDDDMEWMVCYGCEDQEPLLLTEQYLLEFGFGRYDYDNESVWKSNPINGYNIYKTDAGFIMSEVKYPIMYVHQLQNIFFALTGEELGTAKQNN